MIHILNKIFYYTNCLIQFRIGEISAKYPISVMSVALLTVAVLCTGLTQLEVTTNPIKLWAAPDSRARVERRFFESTFRPFFRVQSIVLRPKLPEEIGTAALQPFTRTDAYGLNVTYSPVFDKRFLNKVLELQEGIQDLEVDGVTLSKVCHQPLYPESAECNVQSIWAYWQNDRDNLNASKKNKYDHVDNYLDHFADCSRNPVQTKTSTAMGQSCLSKGGIPVQPYFILGGFNGTVYSGKRSYLLVVVVTKL